MSPEAPADYAGPFADPHNPSFVDEWLAHGEPPHDLIPTLNELDRIMEAEEDEPKTYPGPDYYFDA